MQALVLNESLSYRPDFPEPVLADREALIRLKLAGICATDLELTKGYADFSGIIGHEFVGVVEKVNDGLDSDWLGRRVVGSINIGCGRCEACRITGPEHCSERKVLGIRGQNGVFADFFALPVKNLFAVSERISDPIAVFAEPLAAALRVVVQLRPLSVETVAVLGPGRLGILVAKVLSLHGYKVVVLGKSESSLKLPAQWKLVTALIDAVAENCCECVVDATGQASGLAQALRIIKPRGTLILKSTFVPDKPVDLSKLVVGEINLLGSRCGSFSDALKLLEQEKVPVETMIDGVYALSDGLLAVRHATRSGVRKILLHP
ncbi:alcohol dehydrogenase catalytic domain-containing protein [Methylomonas sp. MgM2]